MSETPPAVLPFPGSFVPSSNFVVGETPIGVLVFRNNGQECSSPMSVYPDKYINFFNKCTPDRFLNVEFPECGCDSIRNIVMDYGVLNLKFGSQMYIINGSGTAFPILMILVLFPVIFCICYPFVYYFSYRMSKKELILAKDRNFFYQWHTRRLSSFMSILLVCGGISLFSFGISGDSEVDVLGLKIATQFPGLILAVLGVVLWAKIISGTIKDRNVTNKKT